MLAAKPTQLLQLGNIARMIEGFTEQVGIGICTHVLDSAAMALSRSNMSNNCKGSDGAKLHVRTRSAESRDRCPC